MQLSEIVGDRLNTVRANAEYAELQTKLDAVAAERDRWQHKWKIERRLSRHLTKKIRNNQKDNIMHQTNIDETIAPDARCSEGIAMHLEKLGGLLDAANAEYALLRKYAAAAAATLSVREGNGNE